MNSGIMSEQAIDRFYEELFQGNVDVLKYGFYYGAEQHHYYFYPIKIEEFTYEIHKYYELIHKSMNFKGANNELKKDLIIQKLNTINNMIKDNDVDEVIEEIRDLL